MCANSDHCCYFPFLLIILVSLCLCDSAWTIISKHIIIFIFWRWFFLWSWILVKWKIILFFNIHFLNNAFSNKGSYIWVVFSPVSIIVLINLPPDGLWFLFRFIFFYKLFWIGFFMSLIGLLLFSFISIMLFQKLPFMPLKIIKSFKGLAVIHGIYFIHNSTIYFFTHQLHLFVIITIPIWIWGIRGHLLYGFWMNISSVP